MSILPGDKFGLWTVENLSNENKDRKQTWRCRCECGTVSDVIGRSLVIGRSRGCGCTRIRALAEKIRIDLTGRQVGFWTVKQYSGLNEKRQPIWLCECQCGTKRDVVGQSLRNGVTKSCGCMKGAAIAKARTKHGHASYAIRAHSPESGTGWKHGHTNLVEGRAIRSRTYSSWEAMKKRCDGKSENSQRYYVRYGIKVCDRWSDFRNFLADMGEAPEGMTLDRHPNNRGNYEPGNCRWATAQQQTDNRRTKGHVVRVAPDEELIEELARRGYNMNAISRRTAA